MDPLIGALRKVRRRIAVVQWVRFMVAGLLTAAIVAGLWVVLIRLFPVLGEGEWVSTGLVVAGVILATVWAILRRPSMLHAALEADKRTGSQERLTSSLELADAEGPMVAALHEDARKRLNGIDLRRAFPLAPPRKVRWLGMMCVAYLVVYLWFPRFDLLGYDMRVAEAKATEAAKRIQVERIENIARPLREQLDEAELAELSGVVQKIERIAQSLEAGEITDKQAAARLSDLSQELAEHRRQLGKDKPMPALSGDPNKLSMTQQLAKDIQQGKYGDAAEKLRDLQEQLGSGELSPEKAEALSKDLEKLSEMLGGNDSALGEALQKAATNLQLQNAAAAMAALEQMEMSLEDLAATLKQMEATQMAMNKMGECKSMMMGHGDCKGGNCGLCNGQGQRFAEGMSGLGGPGRGRGNQIGELPDVEESWDPTMLPGEMTKGKILASILERAAPDPDAESTVEFLETAIIMVQQQAEQALTKEEIPPGAREFVRQYFGSLDPTSGDRQNPQE